ncbi:adenylyltransferase/cytidyltransferase family protein (plasmid) [Paenibacillus peoriae]|uniref:Adenylyltransferase/cytidyltransferase family protein n=1 Tax=Paenibacillus peoriae TaxID=59893 RepID=A0A7H0YH14_9BACL|nr:adenylyltransferase/cytidyltransferase family protein [Paenibacillus peoriae]QNR70372.1 adenylyltransferase/cytidyltransferase family protein [Paenibacillus peoriae]
MTKPFKFGFIVGRFNHIHKGHESLINKGLEMCENLLVLVGSSQESGTMRNPFTVESRMYMIRQIYGDQVNVGFLPDTTHEDDVTYDWGKYVLRNVKLWASVYNLQPNPDVMIYGDDEERGGWYDPADIKEMVQVVVPRGKIDISATVIRRHLLEGNDLAWQSFVNPKLHRHYFTLREKLLEIPEYKEMFKK